MAQDTRTHVVGELYDTERSYVESLQILVEKYMKPLKSLESNRLLIDSNLVDEIFYTIPEILQHHETFLSALQDRLSSDWDSSQVIGNVFIEAFTNQQIIDTYTAFINNWKNARQAIKIATQAKPAFERFLEAMSREHRNKLTLDALLIMPVQRIPRYELLIKELIKHTPENHPDYEPLMIAQKDIHELALKIDRAEKEMIHQEQLKDLESLIEGHVELQNSQRDFIRYDLVTILSASALTAAKKERVLFLFCDLLIMTSVKKKASRRSNLQSAFANSSNDLSLLEGNKFKLLLRVPLDQVEIRHLNDQIQHQQQLRKEQQLHLQQQGKSLQEKKCEIETDLCLLNQMVTLNSKVSHPHKSKINETINELSDHLRDRLFSLDQGDLKFTVENNQQTSQELHINQTSPLSSSPTVSNIPSITNSGSTTLAIEYQTGSISTSTSQNSNIINDNNNSLATTSNLLPPNATPTLTSTISSNASSTSNQQQDSNTSLEFIISNSGTTKDSLITNLSSSSANQTFNENIIIDHSLSLSGNGENQSSTSPTSETLVVTFPSLDRRQAFLMAFIDAKKQRYNLQQRQKIFSTSLTLQLAQPGSPKNELRRTKLHHQDNILDRALFNRSPNKSPYNSVTSTSRNSSAPINHQNGSCASTIVHQMSAPQQLAETTSMSQIDIETERNSSQCNSLSSSNVLSNTDSQCQQFPRHHHHHHHHHHHQLMHQPASQPASLDTICCHDKHNNESYSTKVSSIPHLSRLKETNTDYQSSRSHHNKDYSNFIYNQFEDSSNNKNSLAFGEDSVKEIRSQTLLLKTTPTFFVTIPMNFLNTRHPSLQFTCSLLYNDNWNFHKVKAEFNSNPILIEETRTVQKQQTIRDKSGKIWLCMSNGYVSHVALISIEYKKTKDPVESNNNNNQCKQIKNIVPIIKSSGDICKSHINCAMQIKWSKYKIEQNNKFNGEAGLLSEQKLEGIDKRVELNETSLFEQSQNSKQRLPNVAIKSASPPMDIISKSNDSNGEELVSKDLRLSESAPTKTENISELDKERLLSVIKSTSASTTMLKVPSREGRNKVTNQQNKQLFSKQVQLSKTSSNFSKNEERKCLKLTHGTVCHRHYHHKLQNYPNNEGTTGTQNKSDNLQGYNNMQSVSSDNCPTTVGHAQAHQHHHHHHSHHHHSHHHHHYHGNHHNASHSHQPQVYSSRHHTVPIGELRKALERQNRILNPPNSSPTNNPALIQQNKTNTNLSANQTESDKELHNSSSSLTSSKKIRSTTPPSSYHASKSFRSARLLRHQASLKTSSILAKLVTGAGKKTSYLKKSNNDLPDQVQQNQSEENLEPDTEFKIQISKDHEEHSSEQKQDEFDRNILLKSTNADINEYSLHTGEVDNNLISPLSSLSSSLSSTNSSMTINSVCASSPNHSSCNLLVHSLSTSCCAGPAIVYQTLVPSLQCLNSTHQDHNNDLMPPAMRSRSVTVPSRSVCQYIDDQKKHNCSLQSCTLASNNNCHIIEQLTNENDGYKVSEIIGNVLTNDDERVENSNKDEETNSSLWLGCDDGSLIIIDCLTKQKKTKDENDCDSCESNQNIIECENIHHEIKLNAPICDICVYMDETVFVALSNGQLAIFSRKSDSNSDNNTDTYDWSLTEPKLLTVTTNELNSTSKLCLVSDNYLWYSYGRNIFVLNIPSLKLETTIMVPTNDLSLQFTKQSITIDNMELMANLSGVWISFKNSHLIQFYDIQLYKLLIEINLFDPVNKMLSYGNEIIRQHKTSCLKATSLLNVHNKQENFNTLFIGTSAGIILYININDEQLEDYRKHSDASKKDDFIAQIASLRHGHSGNVKFLHLIDVNDEIESLDNDDNNSNTNIHQQTLLVSGGNGVDLYGPNDDIQYSLPNMNGIEDNLNHLLFWKL